MLLARQAISSIIGSRLRIPYRNNRLSPKPLNNVHNIPCRGISTPRIVHTPQHTPVHPRPLSPLSTSPYNIQRRNIYVPNQSEFRYKVYKANRRRNQPKYSRVYDPFGEDETEIKQRLSPRTKVLIRLAIFSFLVWKREDIVYWTLPHHGGIGIFGDPPFEEEDEDLQDVHGDTGLYLPMYDTEPMSDQEFGEISYDPDEVVTPGPASHPRVISHVAAAMDSMYPDDVEEQRNLKPTSDRNIRN